MGRLPDIAVAYGSNPHEIVPHILSRFELRDRIPPGCSVGIKPNLVVSKPSSSGATTDPEVVEAIIAYLKDRGVAEISILESAWIGDSTDRAFDVCGYRELARRYGVRLVNLESDSVSEHRAGELSMRVCDATFELGFLINVPVLKAHCQTKLTCALKNLKGLIPGSEKRRFHELGLDEPIARLNQIVRPDFTLVDGIIGDLSFEEGGSPVRMDRLFGGTDPVLIDAYAASLLGYTPDDIGHLRRSAEIGVGSEDIEHANIEELNPPEHVEADRFTASREAAQYLRLIEQRRACSACVGGVVHALKRLGEPYAKARLRQSLCVGQGFIDERFDGIGIGDCARGGTANIAGCPPTAIEIRRFLETYFKDG